ncbi:MAG: nucleotidyltransferase family protein [Mogibacterium sp.]|nr:nucleotidyltransferase family protein [Mogibacterium sp.]
MTQTKQTVLNIAAASLFGTSVTAPADTDWPAVLDTVKKQNIVSMAYPVIEKLGIPEDILSEWSIERDKYLANNARVIGSHLRLHKMMNGAGIPYVILKGVASGSYYPDYLLRAYGDVDFLVGKKDYRKVSSLLEADGFSFLRETPRHKEYIKNHTEYEIHRAVSGIQGRKSRRSFDTFLSNIFDEAKEFRHGDSFCMIPSDRHNAVILLTHSADHMYGSGLGLRHLMDWAAFAGSMSDEFFASDMKGHLQELGLWRFCCILTNLGTKYLGLRKCFWAGETDEAFLEYMIEDFFESGDFGRIYQADLIRNRGGVESLDKLGRLGTIRTFFVLLNERAHKLQPVSSVPALLPLGWIFIGMRYIIRMCLGLRTATQARNLVVRFGDRQDLRDAWRLFETDQRDE